MCNFVASLLHFDSNFFALLIRLLLRSSNACVQYLYDVVAKEETNTVGGVRNPLFVCTFF